MYLNLKPQKFEMCILKENYKYTFSCKYFHVFTKSSTVCMDQIFYKKIYSQQ